MASVTWTSLSPSKDPLISTLGIPITALGQGFFTDLYLLVGVHPAQTLRSL